MKIIDQNTGNLIADNIRWAKNFTSRFKGLMFKDHLNDGEGILLYPCDSIHMFFMKISLDILFLDKDMVVIKQINGIKPGQISPIVKRSKYVLEMAESTLHGHETLEGHKLSIIDE